MPEDLLYSSSTARGISGELIGITKLGYLFWCTLLFMRLSTPAEKRMIESSFSILKFYVRHETDSTCEAFAGNRP